MKLQLLLLVPLLFLLENCKEDPIIEPGLYSGEATALKNGKTWSGRTRSNQVFQEPEKLILLIRLYSESGFLREQLGITGINRINRKQLISEINYITIENNTSKISANYITVNGDVVGHVYGLDTLATDNFIQITNVDTTAMEISGIFNVSFILERKGNGTPENPPVNIRFTEGQFTTKVEQEWFE